MKEELPNIDEVEDLESAKGLLKHLITVISTLYALIDELRQTIEGQRHQNEQMQKALFGPTSERVVGVEREAKRKKRREETPEETARRKAKAQKKRADNAEKRRESLETVVVEHEIEDECCAACGRETAEAARLADEISEEYEYVPAKLIRREHHREKRVCACGEFLYGSPVSRVADGVLYGPGLHAHVVVSKCADSIPVERQAKRLRRSGAQIRRSTLNDLFHRTAELLRPIYERMISTLPGYDHIWADETTIKVQEEGKCRKAWMWTFIAEGLVTYVFSPSRSGETPMEVLGETAGTLQVDGYTGYNQVTTPNGRTRAGCWSHVRRKFFAAIKTAPESSRYVLDQILEMYLIEYDAAEKKILGTDAHRILRRQKTKKIVEALFTWLEDEKKKHIPKGPLGQAISYAINQKKALQVFLNNPAVSLDNNLSERNLRLIALGRKNYLFVGHDEGGQNLAILQSLVSSCIANEINPQEYLADVLMRVQEHPQSAIDELLPNRWKPPD